MTDRDIESEAAEISAALGEGWHFEGSAQAGGLLVRGAFAHPVDSAAARALLHLARTVAERRRAHELATERAAEAEAKLDRMAERVEGLAIKLDGRRQELEKAEAERDALRRRVEELAEARAEALEQRNQFYCRVKELEPKS